MNTLYVSDLDGTLLNSDVKISENSKNIINSLIEKGMNFTVATARSLVSASDKIEGLNLKLPVVVYNGTFTMMKDTGKIVNSNYFNKVDRDFIIENIKKSSLNPLVYSFVNNVEKVSYNKNATDMYIEHIKSTIEGDLSGLEIAIDCSNGSSSVTAEKLFTSLGAKVHILSAEPDGTNINQDCGSTHMENLMDYVRKNGLQAGLAFDGDADRCLAVDEKGNMVDGDFLIAICADDMHRRGVLKGNAVVGTVMTNMGFQKFCEEKGLRFEATKVGDRYVLEEMQLSGYNIGGEQSGHIIFSDYATTGDGQLTGVQLMSIMKRRNETLSEMAKVMKRYPQVLINVKISNEMKPKFYTDKAIKAEVKQVTDILGSRGRILVRVSGTEPLVRVMLEGEDYQEISVLAEEAASVVRERLS